MDKKRQALLRLSEIFAEASRIIKSLAELEGANLSVPGGASDGPLQVSTETSEDNTSVTRAASSPESVKQNLDDKHLGADRTRRLLEEKGVKIRNIGQMPNEAEALLTLAGIMGQKHRTIEILLSHIKRAQSSGRQVSLNLAKRSQRVIADITLVASLAS